jgi:hypothetical protein
MDHADTGQKAGDEPKYDPVRRAARAVTNSHLHRKFTISHLTSKLYEDTSQTLNTNLTFDKKFTDKKKAAAMRHRYHRCKLINIGVHSYPFKQRIKSTG